MVGTSILLISRLKYHESDCSEDWRSKVLYAVLNTLHQQAHIDSPAKDVDIIKPPDK
jgi:hypothetical protein